MDTDEGGNENGEENVENKSSRVDEGSTENSLSKSGNYEGDRCDVANCPISLSQNTKSAVKYNVIKSAFRNGSEKCKDNEMPKENSNENKKDKEDNTNERYNVRGKGGAMRRTGRRAGVKEVRFETKKQQSDADQHRSRGITGKRAVSFQCKPRHHGTSHVYKPWPRLPADAGFGGERHEEIAHVLKGASKSDWNEVTDNRSELSSASWSAEIDRLEFSYVEEGDDDTHAENVTFVSELVDHMHIDSTTKVDSSSGNGSSTSTVSIAGATAGDLSGDRISASSDAVWTEDLVAPISEAHSPSLGTSGDDNCLIWRGDAPNDSSCVEIDHFMSESIDHNLEVDAPRGSHTQPVAEARVNSSQQKPVQTAVADKDTNTEKESSPGELNMAAACRRKVGFLLPISSNYTASSEFDIGTFSVQNKTQLADDEIQNDSLSGLDRHASWPVGGVLGTTLENVIGTSGIPYQMSGAKHQVVNDSTQSDVVDSPVMTKPKSPLTSTVSDDSSRTSKEACADIVSPSIISRHTDGHGHSPLNIASSGVTSSRREAEVISHSVQVSLPFSDGNSLMRPGSGQVCGSHTPHVTQLHMTVSSDFGEVCNVTTQHDQDAGMNTKICRPSCSHDCLEKETSLQLPEFYCFDHIQVPQPRGISEASNDPTLRNISSLPLSRPSSPFKAHSPEKHLDVSRTTYTDFISDNESDPMNTLSKWRSFRSPAQCRFSNIRSNISPDNDTTSDISLPSSVASCMSESPAVCEEGNDKHRESTSSVNKTSKKIVSPDNLGKDKNGVSDMRLESFSKSSFPSNFSSLRKVLSASGPHQAKGSTRTTVRKFRSTENMGNVKWRTPAGRSTARLSPDVKSIVKPRTSQLYKQFQTGKFQNAGPSPGVTKRPTRTRFRSRSAGSAGRRRNQLTGNDSIASNSNTTKRNNGSSQSSGVASKCNQHTYNIVKSSYSWASSHSPPLPQTSPRQAREQRLLQLVDQATENIKNQTNITGNRTLPIRSKVSLVAAPTLGTIQENSQSQNEESSNSVHSDTNHTQELNAQHSTHSTMLYPALQAENKESRFLNISTIHFDGGNTRNSQFSTSTWNRLPNGETYEISECGFLHSRSPLAPYDDIQSRNYQETENMDEPLYSVCDGTGPCQRVCKFTPRSRNETVSFHEAEIGITETSDVFDAFPQHCAQDNNRPDVTPGTSVDSPLKKQNLSPKSDTGKRELTGRTSADNPSANFAISTISTNKPYLKYGTCVDKPPPNLVSPTSDACKSGRVDHVSLIPSSRPDLDCGTSVDHQVTNTLLARSGEVRNTCFTLSSPLIKPEASERLYQSAPEFNTTDCLAFGTSVDLPPQKVSTIPAGSVFRPHTYNVTTGSPKFKPDSGHHHYHSAPQIGNTAGLNSIADLTQPCPDDVDDFKGIYRKSDLPCIESAVNVREHESSGHQDASLENEHPQKKQPFKFCPVPQSLAIGLKSRIVDNERKESSLKQASVVSYKHVSLPSQSQKADFIKDTSYGTELISKVRYSDKDKDFATPKKDSEHCSCSAEPQRGSSGGGDHKKLLQRVIEIQDREASIEHDRRSRILHDVMGSSELLSAQTWNTGSRGVLHEWDKPPSPKLQSGSSMESHGYKRRYEALQQGEGTVSGDTETGGDKCKRQKTCENHPDSISRRKGSMKRARYLRAGRRKLDMAALFPVKIIAESHYDPATNVISVVVKPVNICLDKENLNIVVCR